MNDLDSILCELEILSMIKNNGKLCVKSGRLSLEPTINNGGFHGFTSWVLLSAKRKWTQDSREYTLLAIQNVILRLELVIGSLLSASDKLRITDYCKKALPGLEKLKSTYQYDARCVANVEMMVQKLTLIVFNSDCDYNN